ncbi:MAG TPA: CorA family divalent cation transporter [Candidatus Limnocylindrales bacterium]
MNKAEGGAKPRVRARRFDADRTDEVLELDDALASPPSERQLLWLDITGEMPDDLAPRLAKAFDLDDATAAALATPGQKPSIRINGDSLRITVVAQPDPNHPRRSPWLSVVAVPNAVLTHHLQPIGYLDDLDALVEADTAYGLLDSESFLATLLHATVTSYHHAVDTIEEDVEQLDDRSLRDRHRDRLLEDLVGVRARIADLRRLLARHRFVYSALEGVVMKAPDGDGKGAAALSGVAGHYADAMTAVEGARDLVLGSFNVYMTRTAQRTNDTMKILTLVTVLLLPGSLVAGLLGMNVVVPLSKDDPMSFWFVIIGVGLLAVVITLVARRRGWL